MVGTMVHREALQVILYGKGYGCDCSKAASRSFARSAADGRAAKSVDRKPTPGPFNSYRLVADAAVGPAKPIQLHRIQYEIAIR